MPGRKKYLKQLVGGVSVHGKETRITVLSYIKVVRKAA